MATFIQNNQHVINQYNAETINIGTPQNKEEILQAVKQLHQLVEQAIAQKVIQGEAAIDLNAASSKAVLCVESNPPDKSNLLQHLNTAKDLVLHVGDLSGAFNEVITAVQTLF